MTIHRDPPRLGLDMDGVLSSIDVPILGMINEVNGTRLVREDLNQYDHQLVLDFPGGPIALFKEVWRRWKDIPGCELDLKSTIEEARKYCSKIIIASSSTGMSTPMQRLSWLKWWDIPYDEFIQLEPEDKKSGIGIDILVDDSPNIAKHWDDYVINHSSKRFLLRDQPWNRSYHLKSTPTTQRLYNLKELPIFLKEYVEGRW